MNVFNGDGMTVIDYTEYMIPVEYLWVDGTQPTPLLRSKTKILSSADLDETHPLKGIPEWTFDGSSTSQAETGDSDLILVPVRVVKDRLRSLMGYPVAYIALCEVFNRDKTPHISNKRSELVKLINIENQNKTIEQEYHPIVGFEQEYTFLKDGRPLGWPRELNATPPPQGPYYCGVGADNAFGRKIAEDHILACLHAELCIYGINAEVMPGQWEFQIGPKNNADIRNLNCIRLCDDLWIARWLLYRVGEEHGVSATLYPKPIRGDWNGSGLHTNFSTRQTRGERNKVEPMDAIKDIINKLALTHDEHIKNYGADIQLRLTGKCETSSVDKFSWGERSRSSSVRIPLNVLEAGKGYIEDRRPCANADPYVVTRLIIQSTCI